MRIIRQLSKEDRRKAKKENVRDIEFLRRKKEEKKNRKRQSQLE